MACHDADAGVFQPRVLISGSEDCGQDHLAPALLHALEGLPVHSIGLPALLSDASARLSLTCSADYARQQM